MTGLSRKNVWMASMLFNSLGEEKAVRDSNYAEQYIS
jgi:hypothetical protein